MSRPVSVALRELLAGSHFWIHVWMEVENSEGVWVDITALNGVNWFISATWGGDIDSPTMNGTIKLRRAVGADSLVPIMSGSSLNRDSSDAYVPFLQAARNFKLYTATVARGVDKATAFADRWEVFHGKIDDVSWEADPIVISFRDVGAWLQHKFIRTEKNYSTTQGIPLQDVLTQLIADNPPKGGATLVVVNDPSWNVKLYKQGRVNLMDALRNLALQIAYDIRYRYSAAGAFELQLLNPPRDKTVEDFILGPSEYLDVKKLNSGDADVRNMADILFRDAETLADSEILVTNDASIAEFGDRYIEIERSSTGNIDSVTEATQMGQGVVHDLGAPKADQEILTKYLPFVQLYDLIKFLANGDHYDEDQKLGVISFQHELSEGDGHTTIRVRGDIAGAYRTWLNRFGLNTKRIYKAPTPKFTIWAVGSPDQGQTQDGYVWVGVQFEPNTEYVVICSETAPTTPVPVPDGSSITENYRVSRPEGTADRNPFYYTALPIATTHLWYRSVKAYGVGYDGQRSKEWTAEVRAGEPDAVPDSLPGFLSFTAEWAVVNGVQGAKLDWVPDGSLIPDGAVIYLLRNGVAISGEGFDSALTSYFDNTAVGETSVTYELFFFKAGVTGEKRIFVLAPASNGDAPQFTNSTPYSVFEVDPAYSLLGPVEQVVIAWSCSDPAAVQIEVQWSATGEATGWGTVFTSTPNAATAASGSTKTRTTSRGYFRLRSRDNLGNLLAISEAKLWAGTTSTPPTGTAPSLSARIDLANLMVLNWTCSDANAHTIQPQLRYSTSDPWADTAAFSPVIDHGTMNVAADPLEGPRVWVRVQSRDLSNNPIASSNEVSFSIEPPPPDTPGIANPV